MKRKQTQIKRKKNREESKGRRNIHMDFFERKAKKYGPILTELEEEGLSEQPNN